MTLSRQLMLSGLFILLLLFLGMITFVIKNTQTFLDEQLSSHSQDTATALGLTLTTIMKNDDIVTASRVVDAVWDRGYYQSILVENVDGTPLVVREMKIKVYAVPQWFIQLLHLHTEPKEALIMEGWRKIGKVKIRSNPGFAYQQIWLTFMESLGWLMLTAFITLPLGSLLLYIILKPLRAITLQALAICNQQFPIQASLPRTVDLRMVVEAMNNMSRRLKNLFKEQSEISEQLRAVAYKEVVTNLGNRRFFDLQMDYLLKDEEVTQSGLLLIELIRLKEYNEKYGFQEGDILLQNAAKTIQDCCQGIDKAIVTHAKGASMMVLMPEQTLEGITQIAAKIGSAFNEFYHKGLSKEQDAASIGGVLFHHGDSKNTILSQADMALRKAQMEKGNQWIIETIHPEMVHGAKDWEAIFAKVIRQNQVLLHFQETQLWGSEEVNAKTYETFMRLKLSENEIIPAGIFMPMAERLNQIQALDQLVINNIIDKLLKSTTIIQYAVNISPSAIDNSEFLKWLLAKVKSIGKKAKQLIIELPEYGVINRIDQVRDFYLKFSALGGKTSIDHYGKNFSSFSYLYNLKLTYLKIDGSYIKNIHENEENKFFIRSLVDIAHSLGILVIAEAVESENEYATLKKLKVDGAQGYYIGKPSALI